MKRDHPTEGPVLDANDLISQSGLYRLWLPGPATNNLEQGLAMNVMKSQKYNRNHVENALNQVTDPLRLVIKMCQPTALGFTPRRGIGVTADNLPFTTRETDTPITPALHQKA